MPSMPATAPRVVSGVELLNNALADVRRRIYDVSNRVGDVANQFGSPSTEPVPASATKSPESTNDWMSEINIALASLERITSRIDNQ